MGTKSRVTVDFKTTARTLYGRQAWVPQPRRYGCGLITPSGPYAGPSLLILKGHDRRGQEREFRVSRVSRSPTGSGHGSFRVEESKGDKIVPIGYTCSVPDFDDCMRVWLDNRHHE